MLSLDMVNKNCRVFLDSNFTNIYADTENTVTGFSNWNPFSKSIKVVTDYLTNYVEYEKVKKVVLKTLERIEEQLNTPPKVCPLYFFMVNEGYHGAKQISYYEVLTRIEASATFKNDSAIQAAVKRAIDLFNKHPMGSDAFSFSEKGREEHKLKFFCEVEQDLKKRYCAGSSQSIRALNDAYVTCGSSKELLQPPPDPMNATSMQSYLQKKVEALALSEPSSYFT